ncbi:MAG: hypothetical protein ACK4QL_01120 [Pseudanabaenaceae cyanobacterium]
MNTKIEAAIDIDPELELYPFNEPAPGSPPRTLVIDAESGIPNIFVIDYSAQEAVGKQLAVPEGCIPYLESDQYLGLRYKV